VTTQRKLRLYINPSWTVYGWEDFQDLPEGWDNWTVKEKNDFIEESIWQQIEDSGHEIVSWDDGESQ
jgi:hypothetical protein